MAFDWFARCQVDVAVIETGLGGRLDSTNVVRPVSAGVTAIGIDHVEYLGTTRESIAFEKAGIFKAGAAAVIGEPDPSIADLLEQHAREHGASPIARVWRDAPPTQIAVTEEGTTFDVRLGVEVARLKTPLAGAHQASNTVTALLMLSGAGPPWAVTLGESAQALERVRLPGRFHREGQFIFDVAHNPDGAAVLAATVRAVGVPRPVAALLTVLTDKDWRGVMGALAPVVEVFVLTSAPTAPTSRAWNADEALAYATSRGWHAVLERDFDRAISTASSLAATVLVTGSFHTVGDAMARLQVDPLAG
jgi:dihydrofolate synthase/folylpolyglutamate synthase